MIASQGKRVGLESWMVSVRRAMVPVMLVVSACAQGQHDSNPTTCSCPDNLHATEAADSGAVAEEVHGEVETSDSDVLSFPVDALDVITNCTPKMDSATGLVAGKLQWKVLSSSSSVYLSVGTTCKPTLEFHSVIPAMSPTNSGAWLLSPPWAGDPGSYSNHPDLAVSVRNFERHVLVARHVAALPSSATPVGDWGDWTPYMVKASIKAKGPAVPKETLVLYSPTPLAHGGSKHGDLQADTHLLKANAEAVDAVVVNVSAALHIVWKKGTLPSVETAPDHPMHGNERWDNDYSTWTFPPQNRPVSHLVANKGQQKLFLLHRLPKGAPHSVHAWTVTENGFSDHQLLVPKVAPLQSDIVVAPRSVGGFWLAVMTESGQVFHEDCYDDPPLPPCAESVALYAVTSAGATQVASLSIPAVKLQHMDRGLVMLSLDAEHVAFAGFGGQLHIWSQATGLVSGGNLFLANAASPSPSLGPFAAIRGPGDSWVVLAELQVPGAESAMLTAIAISQSQGASWATVLPIFVGGSASYRGVNGVVRDDGHTLVYGETGFVELDERGNFNLDPLCFGPKAPECDDGDPCTFDTCDTAGKCVFTAKPNGTLCAMAPPKFCSKGLCAP